MISIVKRFDPFILAAATAAGLLCLDPAVGFVQPAMAAVILAGATRWWRGELAEGERGPRWPALFVLAAVGVQWTWFLATTRGYSFGFSYVFWERWEFQFQFLLSAALIGVAVTSMLGAWRVRTTVQAVAIGALTTAAWVPIGAEMGLDYYLRMHPLAICSMVGTTWLFYGVSALRRRDPVHLHRFFALVVVQCIGLWAYWATGSSNKHSTLGYHAAPSSWTSADGTQRVELHTEPAVRLSGGRTHGPDVTVMKLHDRRTGRSRHIGAVHPPFSGLSVKWNEHELEWRVFVPSSRFYHGCSGTELSLFFFDNQTDFSHVPLR